MELDFLQKINVGTTRLELNTLTVSTCASVLKLVFFTLTVIR